MVLAGSLAYLELPKTGCTHIGLLLRTLFGGEDIGPKHNRLPDTLKPRVRFVVGSIRNPWDWYVSLWAFGCSGQGLLYYDLTSRNDEDSRARAARWRETYANVADPGRFREWLRRLHDPANRRDIRERYADSPISLTGGLLTYRYAYLYAEDVRDVYAEAIASAASLRTLLEHTMLGWTIRTERLAPDLAQTLHACGFDPSAAQLGSIFSTPSTNAAHRPQVPYYDRATADLVAARDRWLIDIYGYSAPDIVAPALL